jgi:hypothetical protein
LENAFEFRNELLHDFSFAYRDVDDVKKKVIRIRKGGSNADICKLLISSAPVGFDPPRGLFALPGDFSPSTTTFHPPRCDFLSPQRDLILHNGNFHAHK